MEAPKLFLSHASEDKEFALVLATKLRADGVDAWIDKWEIRVGDKLTQRIFREGIGNSDCFAIVLSNASVAKPWVREELDAAMIRAIEEQTRLLVIRIDDCEVPVELRSRKVEGTVVVSFIVDATGRVVQPKVEKATLEAFERPALDAVRQWRFDPAVRAGEKVPSRLRIPIRFSLG